MTKYKVGDKVRILFDQECIFAPDGIYKKDEIHIVAGVDHEGDPWFEGDQNIGSGWYNRNNWFEKVEG